MSPVALFFFSFGYVGTFLLISSSLAVAITDSATLQSTVLLSLWVLPLLRCRVKSRMLPNPPQQPKHPHPNTPNHITPTTTPAAAPTPPPDKRPPPPAPSKTGAVWKGVAPIRDLSEYINVITVGRATGESSAKAYIGQSQGLRHEPGLICDLLSVLGLFELYVLSICHCSLVVVVGCPATRWVQGSGAEGRGWYRRGGRGKSGAACLHSRTRFSTQRAPHTPHPPGTTHDHTISPRSIPCRSSRRVTRVPHPPTTDHHRPPNAVPPPLDNLLHQPPETRRAKPPMLQDNALSLPHSGPPHPPPPLPTKPSRPNLNEHHSHLRPYPSTPEQLPHQGSISSWPLTRRTP